MMIARHRGEERLHRRWRPTAATGAVAEHRDPELVDALDADPTAPELVDRAAAGSRRLPALIGVAAAFKAESGQSCLAYYSSVGNSSFRIRHILQDGPTATVEAQQLGHGREWGYFTLVLTHVHGGWQAVDLVPGGSVRAR
jgi:hypothetical protein